MHLQSDIPIIEFVDLMNVLSYKKSSIKKTYADDSNSRASAHNRGVRVGADQVIMKYEKKCLDDNTDECTDLGNAASQGGKSKQIVIL